MAESSWVWVLVAAGVALLVLNVIDVGGVLYAKQGYVGPQMGGWKPIETYTQRF